MKKQITSALVLVSAILSITTAAHAQGGVADNFASTNTVEEVSPYQNGSDDNFNCNDADLSSDAGCNVMVMMGVMRSSDVKILAGKRLVIQGCDDRTEISQGDLRRVQYAVLDNDGFTRISNMGMDCQVNLKYINK